MAWRVANLTLGALFAVSAALQLDDPDPLRWMAVYGASALACVASSAGWPGARWLAGATGVIALGWAASLLPATLPGFEARQLLRSMKADTPEIELGRELLGLLIVAAWMSALVVRPAIGARGARPARGPR